MYKQGTILIELSVVLTASVSLLLLGIHFFSGTQQIISHLELTLLAMSIKTMQQTSLITGKEQSITFDTTGSGYSSKNTIHRFAQGVQLCAPSGALGPPSSPQKPIPAYVTFKNHTITCTKHGTIQSGTVYLGTPSHNIFYALTSGVAQFPFLRLYKYRLKWIPL
jgi:hypothetical protein